MKVRNTILFIALVILISSCNQNSENSEVHSSLKKDITKKNNDSFLSNKIDTLKIKYADTAFVFKGKQIYPKNTSTSNLDRLMKKEVLLFFKSDNYYFVFYNKMSQLDFLSDMYWSKSVPKYINYSVNLNLNRFQKVNYSDGPFLTGLYNSKDSIIVMNNNLSQKDFENSNLLPISYFSTTDTLLKLGNNISVGDSLKKVLTKLKIPNNFKPQKEFKLILRVATNQVKNKWFKRYPKNVSNFSYTVILSIRDSKLSSIKFIDLEYFQYVLMKKNIFTKDITLQ